MIEPLFIHIEDLNLPSLFPMIIAIIGALVIICIDLFTKNLHKSFYLLLTILILVIDFIVTLEYNGLTRGFFEVMLTDGIATLSQLIIIGGSIVFILLTVSPQDSRAHNQPEYFALFLFGVGGFLFMVSTDNLILILLSLETSSLVLYILIAMDKKERSLEAAIKYFTMGALAAAFLAFGSMIFYALTGSVELGQISAILVASDFQNYPLVLVGVVFILGGLGFKLSLVPFHTWTPDVYQGSNAALAGYISVIPKIAAFVVALRFFEIFISVENRWVELILYTVVVLTITIPNIAALVQTDMKRMLAFSSISHAGFVMAAIFIGTTQATQTLFLYWILFGVTNLAAFTMLWIHSDPSNPSDHLIEKFSGLIHTSPLSASVIALCMLSLAGIPPLSLFWGKLFLLSSTLSAGYTILALIMAVNSAIAIYYYLKPIVFMFLRPPNPCAVSSLTTHSSTSLQLLIAGTVLLIVSAIFMIEPLLDIIGLYVEISGY